MSKTYKKHYDEDEPDDYLEAKHRMDRRKEKRFKRALKTKDIAELLKYDELENLEEDGLEDGSEVVDA